MSIGERARKKKSDPAKKDLSPVWEFWLERGRSSEERPSGFRQNIKKGSKNERL